MCIARVLMQQWGFRLTFFTVVFCFSHAALADVPVVSAASDLQFALKEVAQSFRRDSGRDLKISFLRAGDCFNHRQYSLRSATNPARI